MSAAPATVAFTRKVLWHKQARVAWSSSHNPHLMLGIAY
jgi:hypothetical protein